jgi:hypothetical protein
MTPAVVKDAVGDPDDVPACAPQLHLPDVRVGEPRDAVSDHAGRAAQ